MFSLHFHRDMVTLMKVSENSKLLWKHSPVAHVSTAFLILLNFTCVTITLWKPFSINILVYIKLQQEPLGLSQTPLSPMICIPRQR